MNISLTILLIFYFLLILSFCIAIIKISKLKSHKRLIWHLIVCFMPIIGPLIFFASESNKHSNE